MNHSFLLQAKEEEAEFESHGFDLMKDLISYETLSEKAYVLSKIDMKSALQRLKE